MHRARLLPGATVRRNPALPPGVIELITGTRYAGLKTAPYARAAHKPRIAGLSKTYGGINGSARMCSRAGQATFTGPGTVSG